MYQRLCMPWFIKSSRISTLVVIIGLILSQSASYAQNRLPLATSAPQAQNRWISLPDTPQDDITPQQYARIEDKIAHNRLLLTESGKLHSSPQQSFTPFIFPLRFAPGVSSDYGFHARGQFVDHNPAYPDQILDYNAGNRTYDLAGGYNHSGTDIVLWPFAWQKMEVGAVQVVAAAAGTITEKEDNHPDHSCGFVTTDPNYISIENEDHTYTTIYFHLKAKSLTQKPVGAKVAAGEYLGLVGSSGNSSSPHLHFEVRDASGKVIVDPFFGPANTTIGMTLWDQQPAYYDSAINHLGTGTLPPVFPACPATETSNEQTEFVPGSTIYFASYYREQIPGQLSQFAIYRPDQSRFAEWSDVGPKASTSASYGLALYTIPATEPEGIWRFEVIYQGHTYQHTFAIRSSIAQKFAVYIPVVNR